MKRGRVKPDPDLGDWVKAWFGLLALVSICVVVKVIINVLTK